MPVPDSSDFTRQLRILANESVQGTTRNKRSVFVPAVSGAAFSFFLPRATLQSPSKPAHPTFTLFQSAVTVDEGESIVFTLTTTNVADGTTLYWTTSGTTTASEFADNLDSGSFSIAEGGAMITRTIKSDAVVDPNQTFVLSIRADSISGPVLAVSSTVTVNDTTPTYTINPSVSSVDEGSSVVYTLATTKVPDGTVLYWTNSGTTVAADFSDNANSGSVTVVSGSATITRTLLLDAVASESENIILQLRTRSTTGTVVATAGTVTVVDKTAVYAVSASASSVDEGQSVTFTVTTANVANGTTLYWTALGTVTGNDFTDSAMNGSFTITSNLGTIVRSIKNDTSSEGSETFTLSIRTGSVSGTVVAMSGTVTINDTSIGTTFTWVQQPPIREWADIYMSSNGTVLISSYTSASYTPSLSESVLGPYISTNGGTTWTRKVTGLPNPATTVGLCVAKSSPNILYVAIQNGSIFKSTDTGNNWTQVRTSNSWYSLACSSNGQVVMSVASETVYISTDSGTTWTTTTFPGAYLAGTAMSADGTILYVTNGGGDELWKSTNSGVSWSVAARSSTYFYPIRCSADGQVVAAGQGGSDLFFSTDGGTTKTTISAVPNQDVWFALAVSGDGNTIVVGRYDYAGNSPMYVSVDRGVTWASYNLIGGWGSVDVDSTGRKIVGGGAAPTQTNLYIGTR